MSSVDALGLEHFVNQALDVAVLMNTLMMMTKGQPRCMNRRV